MKLILTIIALCSIHFTFAQTTNVDLTLGIVMPDADGDIREGHIQKLQTKLTQIINNSHQVMAGYDNDFIIYPTVSIGESADAEGGLQKINVTSVELTLTVMQLSTKVVFNTMDLNIKGSGNNKELAITNAFSNMKTTGDNYNRFIAETKTKILEYYNSNCSSIIQRSKDLETKKDYVQAIVILEAIPEKAACYPDARKRSLQLYTKYEHVFCAKLISIARSALAVKEYYTAMQILLLVDPGSSCTKEADNLIKETEGKTDRAIQREYDMDKLRINAVKEIGKSYFSSQAYDYHPTHRRKH